jgi:hypothetical protein
MMIQRIIWIQTIIKPSDPSSDNDDSNDQAATEDDQQENQDTNNPSDTVDTEPDNTQTEDTAHNQDSKNNQTSADNDDSNDQAAAEDNQQENQDTNNPSDTVVDTEPDNTQTEDSADNLDSNNTQTEDTADNQDSNNNQTSDPSSDNDDSNDQAATEDNQQENQDTNNSSDTLDTEPDNTQTEDPADNQDSNNNQTSDPSSENDDSNDQATTEDNQQENQDTNNSSDTVDTEPDNTQTEDSADNLDSNSSQTDNAKDNQDSNNNQTSDPIADNDDSNDQAATEDNQQENQDTNNSSDNVDTDPNNNQTEEQDNSEEIVVNIAPIITSNPVEQATEDIEYSYAAQVLDPDDTNNGTDLKWGLSNEPVGMKVSSRGVVTWTPTEGKTTSGEVTLSVFDDGESDAKPDTQTFTISVIAVNDSPILHLCQNLLADELKLFKCTIEATDAEENTNFTYSLIKSPEGMAIDSNSGKITWTPDNKSTNFEKEITVEVNDGSGASNATASESFTIRVNAIDDKPHIVHELQQAEVYEDIVYTLILKVNDPDSDHLTVTFNQRPDWLKLNSSSPEKEGDPFTIKLEGTPLNRHVGENYLNMVITDGKSDITYETVIKVSNTNDSPDAQDKLVTVKEQATLPIKLEATDPDKNESLIFTIVEEPTHMDKNSFLIINNSTVTYRSNSNTAKSDKFSFKVCDKSNACDTATVNIAITPIDDQPSTKLSETAIASEDTEYTYQLRIEDPDSDVLFLHLDKFPNWLKLNEYYGQGDKVKLYKNTVGHFEASFRGTPTDLYTDDNYDNTVKISIGDSPLATDDNIVTFQLRLNVININDNPEPWAWGSDSELVRREEGGTEWDWLLPSNIVAKDSIEFSLNLYEYITFVDADDDTIICGASLHNGEPLPEWLTVSKQKNTPCKTYFFSGTPSEEDLSKPSLKIRVNGYDNSGSIASVFFELPLKNIEYDPILTGDFTAPIYLKSSYTLTADDLFYHDFDSADSLDKVIFHVSNMQNGYFQNFPLGSLSFTGEQLLNGELTWILDNNETPQDASFDVLITDNSGRSSSTTVFNLSVKKSSKSNLAPELTVDLQSKTFNWKTNNNTSNATYEYLFCEWDYDYMQAINCLDWVESENPSYTINEDISGRYSLHVREVQRFVDSEGTQVEIRSPIALKPIAIPIIRVFDKNGNELTSGSVTSEKEVIVEIDLLFDPAVSWGSTNFMQRMFNELTSDPLQFYPKDDITVDNATWTSESDTITGQKFRINVTAEDINEVKVTIPANQYSRAEDTSEQNAMASVSWRFDNAPFLFKINPRDPNTFIWYLFSGGGDFIFLYRLYNWELNKKSYAPEIENVSYRKDQWKKDNGDILDVEIDLVIPDTSPKAYIFTIKGSGQYTIEAKEKFEGNYPSGSKKTIFIPQINVLNSVNHLITSHINTGLPKIEENSVYHLITSNTNIGLSKTDRTTQYQTVTLSIDTMVRPDSFSEKNLFVTNGEIVKETWRKISSTKYEVKIKATHEGTVKVTIDKKAYKESYQNEFNVKAEVTWEYDPNHKPSPTIMQNNDVKTIKSNGNLSNAKPVTIKINVSEYEKNWPNVNWKDSYLQVENIHKRSDFRKCSPENKPEICTYPMLITDQNCSSSEGCKVKVFVNNPDGYSVDSFQWKYVPRPEDKEQEHQLGPAPELILRDEIVNNQEERIIEIKGINFTIGRNTSFNHPDIEVQGGQLVQFRQIGLKTFEAKIRANESGTITAKIKENIDNQNNKSASINWIYQHDDNSQNSKTVAPTITIKDSTGKISNTTNRSRVTVEIDTKFDTTGFERHHLQIKGGIIEDFEEHYPNIYLVGVRAHQPNKQVSLNIGLGAYRENQESKRSSFACQESKAHCKINAEATIQWTYDPKYNSDKKISIGWTWSPKISTGTRTYTGIYRYRRAGTENWTETEDNFYYPMESPSEGIHILEVQARFNSPDESNRTYVTTQWDTSTEISLHVKNLKIAASPKSETLLEAMYNLEVDIKQHVFETYPIIGDAVANNGRVTYKTGTLKNIKNNPDYDPSANYQDSFILKSYTSDNWEEKSLDLGGGNNVTTGYPIGDPAITSFFTVSIIDETFFIQKNNLFSLEVVDGEGSLTGNLSRLVKDAKGNIYPELLTFNHKEFHNESVNGSVTIFPTGEFTYSLKDYDFPKDKYSVQDSFSYTAQSTVTGQQETGIFFLNINRNFPINIAINGQYTKQAEVNTKLENPPSVTVTDSKGKGIQGVTVKLKIVEGNGYIKTHLPLTDKNGIVALDSWTLGKTAGINKLTASIGEGLINTNVKSVEFEVEGIAGQAIKFNVVQKPLTGDKENEPKNYSGKPIPVQPKIEIYDQYGNLAKNSNAKVTVTIDNNGTLSCNQPCQINKNNNKATINATQGIATFTDLVLEGNVGQSMLWKGEGWETTNKPIFYYYMTFHSDGLESDNRIYRLSLTAGDPSQLIITEPTSSIKIASGGLLTPIKVELRDSAGNLTVSTAKVEAIITCNQECGINGHFLGLLDSNNGKDLTAGFYRFRWRIYR